MIKKVKLINKIGNSKNYDVINEENNISLSLFSFSPSLLIPKKMIRIEYLIGEVKETSGYKICRLYLSDNKGVILDQTPIIEIDDIEGFEEVFSQYNYTLVD